MANEKKPTIHKPASKSQGKASAVALKADHKPAPKKNSDLGKKIGLGIGGLALVGLGGVGVMHVLNGGNNTAKVKQNNSADKSGKDSTLDFESSKKDKKKKKDSASKQSRAETNLNAILDSSNNKGGSSSSSSNNGGSSKSGSKGKTTDLNNLFDGTAGGSGNGSKSSLTELASAAKAANQIADVLGGNTFNQVINAPKAQVAQAAITNSGSTAKPISNVTKPVNNGNSTSNNGSSSSNANNHSESNSGSYTKNSGSSSSNTGSHHENGNSNNHSSGNNSHEQNQDTYTKEHPNWDYSVGTKTRRTITLLDKNGKKVGSLSVYVVVSDKGNGKRSFTIHYNKKKIPKGYTLDGVNNDAMIDAYFGKDGKTASSLTINTTKNNNSGKDNSHNSEDNDVDNVLQDDGTMTVTTTLPEGNAQYAKNIAVDGNTYGNLGVVTSSGNGEITVVSTLKGKDGKTYTITRKVAVGRDQAYYDSDANTKVKHVVQLADVNVEVGKYYSPANPKIYTENGTELDAEDGVTGIVADRTGKHKVSFRIGDTEFVQQVNFCERKSGKSSGNNSKSQTSGTTKKSKKTSSKSKNNKSTKSKNTVLKRASVVPSRSKRSSATSVANKVTKDSSAAKVNKGSQAKSVDNNLISSQENKSTSDS